jgi:hypothetical protein
VPSKLQQAFANAGQHAAQWYIDTDDCRFCNVDSAPKGQSHERFCPFYGISDKELEDYLRTLPVLEVEE